MTKLQRAIVRNKKGMSAARSGVNRLWLAHDKMKKTTTFWMQQLRFAQANLDFLEYAKGRANIDQKRLRTLIRTQESQMEQCELAICAEDLKARINGKSQPVHHPN
jgi:hypothetical protein